MPVPLSPTNGDINFMAKLDYDATKQASFPDCVTILFFYGFRQIKSASEAFYFIANHELWYNFCTKIIVTNSILISGVCVRRFVHNGSNYIFVSDLNPYL